MNIDLSLIIKQVAYDLEIQIKTILNSGSTEKQQRVRILELWKRWLSPVNPAIRNLDNYGIEVMYGYRSLVADHTSKSLSFDQFERYVLAVLSMMKNIEPGEWNECEITQGPIICIETGDIYSSIVEVAKSLTNVDLSLIELACKDQSKMAAGYHWAKYVE